MTRILLWLGFVLLVVGYGCSDPEGLDGSLPPPSPPTTVDPAPVDLAVGPEGGTVHHPSGVELVIPEGALAVRTKIVLTPVAAPSAAQLGAVPVGFGVDASPAGLTFLKPVVLRLPFDPTRIPAGRARDSVQVRMAPQATNDFSVIGSRVDATANVVVASTVHFTTFVPSSEAAPIFVTAPSSLPAGAVGSAYTTTLGATGGVPPYTWMPSAGATLPPGLALGGSGVLAGTPSGSGVFAFFVTVTDRVGTRVQAPFDMIVTAPPSPVPVLLSISPTTIGAGAPTTTVAATGSAFAPTSVVRFDGQPLPTTFVSGTQLTASIAAARLAVSGMHAITVSTPAPGGGTSGTLSFEVTVVNAVPVVSTVAPTTVPVATVATQVTVRGHNFIASSSVAIGSTGIPTTFVSSTELKALVPASALGAPGTIQLSVYTPPPGGGFSTKAVPLTVSEATVTGPPCSRSFGDANRQFIYGVASDPSGAAVVVGAFQGSMVVGGTTLTNTNAGTARDGFVAKFDALCNVVFVRALGGPSDDIFEFVKTDALGNIYIAGDVMSDIDFGTGTLTGAGGYDIVVVKMDGSGTTQWAKRFGNASTNYVKAFDVDPAGNIAMGGSTIDSLDFGGGNVMSTGSHGSWIAKLSTAGAHAWSYGFPGDKQNQTEGIAFDGNGDVHVIGIAQQFVDFGSGAIDFGPATGFGTFFLKRSGATGAHLLADARPGVLSPSITVDAAGDVILTGQLWSATISDFGDGPLADPGPTGALVARTGVAAKFDGATHALQWSRGFGIQTGAVKGTVNMYGATTTPSGQIRLATRLRGSADYGGGVHTSTDTTWLVTLTNAGAWSAEESFGTMVSLITAATPFGNTVVGGYSGESMSENAVFKRNGP